MTRRPDSAFRLGAREASGSLFRTGIAARLAAALGLSALLWLAILWASA